MPQRGLTANRRLTHWFIMDDPYRIVLHRRVKVDRPGGAYDFEDGPPMPEQIVKIVYKGGANSSAGAEGLQITSDGQENRFDFAIVAEWDADIQPGDWWEDANGLRWEIKGLIPSNDYEVRASVSAYGKNPGGG